MSTRCGGMVTFTFRTTVGSFESLTEAMAPMTWLSVSPTARR